MNLHSKSKPYYILLGFLILSAPQLSYAVDRLSPDTQTTLPNPNPITDVSPANPDVPVTPELVAPKTQDTTTTNAPDAPQMEANTLTPAEALDRLMAGNKRFVENNMVCPDKTQERRTATAKKQAPFAIVLGCSDSRVSPELAFVQGIGDIYVVRTAGNSAGPIEIDSVEYSVQNNNSSIILVLGHQNCKAVEAVYTGNDADIPDIKKLIKPAVDKVKKLKNHTLNDAVIVNIRNSMARLKTSAVIKKYIDENKIRLQGGYYHLDTGKVDILPEGIVP
jgi:carbonic anhydrase